MRRKLLCIKVVTMIATIGAANVSVAARWEIVELGVLPGPNNVRAGALAINQLGEVAGYSGTSSSSVAVRFSGNSAESLGIAGSALDINIHGDIIVSFSAGPWDERAYIYSNGKVTDLGGLGTGSSFAWAINDSGTVVGRASIVGGEKHAFIYHDGVMTDIGGLTATDINNKGDVVGLSLEAGGPQAFLYKNGVKTSLAGASAVPLGINENGLIVGQITEQVPGSDRAAYYQNGAWYDLGILGSTPDSDPWDRYSSANDVNNRNQIVGSSISPYHDTQQHAFIYSNGVMHDLTSLLDPGSGWSALTSAYGINDRGQIVGTGWKNGMRAFLMTPVIDEFALDVVYSNPLLLQGSSDYSSEVATKFVLSGIAGMPGMFRLEDVISVMAELQAGVWTEVSLNAFEMTLGPGGVDDILTLSYSLEPIVMPDGRELSLHNSSFQLFVDGRLPSGETFAYQYLDSMQSLTVVPEPSTLALAALGIASVACCSKRRR